MGRQAFSSQKHYFGGIDSSFRLYWGSDGKESTCTAGDLRLIPGSRRCREKEMGTHSGILAWKSTWTEEPVQLQSLG